MNHNLEYWLSEVDVQGNPAQGGAIPAGVATQGAAAPAPGADNTAAQPNTSPGLANGAPGQQPDPNVANTGQADSPDITKDPQAPDMPEKKPEISDFEEWKANYIKESINGDIGKLRELLLQVRDKEGLLPNQKKFIDDNWNIQLLRENSNIDKASRQIRNQIKSQLDKNNPSTSILNHLSAVLETMPMLNNIFIKLNGYDRSKGDLHRKYIAALLGAVQVGNGGNKEDLIYNDKEYGIYISTRYNALWGEVMLGNWSLKEDDPERYLSEPELKRLQDGSPEERSALRKRVVVESIAGQFETRSFLIQVAGEDGTIYALGWDIAGSLRAAHADGKLIVKTRKSDNSEAMIDDDGNIVPLMDISINYAKETGAQDEDGEPEVKEVEFMERRGGTLFLTADLKLIREASTALQGANFKEIPYNGNPSDLKTLQRCVYSAGDLILRQC